MASVRNILVIACLTFRESFAFEGYSALRPRLQTDEEDLLTLLFSNYNPSARPVLNSSATVQVMFHFALMQIQDLDLRRQEFHTAGLLILEWYDERLAWDTDRIALEEVSLESKWLWTPDFASINGANGLIETFKGFNAILHHDGRINWEPGGVFRTMCEVDITYYPFDEQTCQLVFGAWSYTTTKMNLTTAASSITMDSYKVNGEWTVTGTEVNRNEFAFECCPDDKFSNVAFTVHVRRKYAFYIMNVILPSIMTSVLLLSVFFCTPAQKVHLGIAVLLSFRFFLMAVTSSIPKTDHIPLIGIYLTCTMIYTTISMVITVFVLNLHHISDRPVPTCVNRLVRCYVARCLCMFNHVIKGKHARAQKKGDDGDYSREWQMVAEVVDRVFFVLYLLLTVLTTLLMFYPTAFIHKALPEPNNNHTSHNV